MAVAARPTRALLLTPPLVPLSAAVVFAVAVGRLAVPLRTRAAADGAVPARGRPRPWRFGDRCVGEVVACPVGSVGKHFAGVVAELTSPPSVGHGRFRGWRRCRQLGGAGRGGQRRKLAGHQRGGAPRGRKAANRGAPGGGGATVLVAPEHHRVPRSVLCGHPAMHCHGIRRRRRPGRCDFSTAFQEPAVLGTRGHGDVCPVGDRDEIRP
mmetsp:Transcript_84999/g.245471  ORF Transcript_84999/g.245471 Transcript_84999/m.245471 type:complete len:210 (+) Transcript_84999:61-690(+)